MVSKDFEPAPDTKDPDEGFWPAYRASPEKKRRRFTGCLKFLGGVLLTGIGISALSAPSPLAVLIALGVPMILSGLVQTITGRRHSMLQFLKRE